MHARLRSSFHLALALAATVALGACKGGSNTNDTATAGGTVTDTSSTATGGTGTDTSRTGTDTSRRDSSRTGTDTSRSRTPR